MLIEKLNMWLDHWNSSECTNEEADLDRLRNKQNKSTDGPGEKAPSARTVWSNCLIRLELERVTDSWILSQSNSSVSLRLLCSLAHLHTTSPSLQLDNLHMRRTPVMNGCIPLSPASSAPTHGPISGAGAHRWDVTSAAVVSGLECYRLTIGTTEHSVIGH